MRDDRIRQFLAELLADIAVFYARLVHKGRGDDNRKRHARNQQSDAPVDDVHKRGHEERRKAVAQHVGDGLHNIFFDKHHIGREHRADLSDIASRKVAHRKFPKVRAQLHALFGKDLIPRRALQSVAQIGGENMHGKRRRHARKVDEAASYGYCALVELIEEQKAEKERHHDTDALDEREQRRREHPALVFARKL